jgi:ABC transport system ATP-binding/permease protein
MALLRLRNVTFSYGGANLLEDVGLEIRPGERIGLMGRNGAGKSTLLKLLQGVIQPDDGTIERAPALRVAQLAQEVPAGSDHTVLEEVARGFGEQGLLVAQMLKASHRSHSGAPASQLDSSQLDTESAWQIQRRIDEVLSRMDLDPSLMFDTLSSGMKRRVLLAQALVSEPDLLLLDEPTNHLDLDSIRWIEDFLLREAPTLVFVTHDRVFLQRIATRIVEVERARLFDWTCDYATFLVRKESLLAGEAQQDALFDKKLAEEEVWIRQGVKARRTRNEGRVRALERMREERRARRAQMGNVRLQTQDVERSGNLVIAAEGISHAFDGRSILDDVSVTISRGDKIGILGPNGSGKTTLLRILLGELSPARGTVRRGTNVQIAYFDQLRAQLDEEKSAVDNVADGKEMVLFNGKSRHVLGYLRDFLFSSDRARSLVRYLSGGERNRLLLARMFTRSANLLVLDEPTNDLDSETLELLEEMLVDFPGTLLLVSHDRAFLNNVVTSTLVFEADGCVKEFVGGYDDWVRQKTAGASPSNAERPKSERERSQAKPSRKLSYKEQRQLEDG